MVLNHCTIRGRGEPACSPFFGLLVFNIRADTQVCPYDFDDAMQMIRHDDKFIQFYRLKPLGQFVPDIHNDFTVIADIDHFTRNRSK